MNFEQRTAAARCGGGDEYVLINIFSTTSRLVLAGVILFEIGLIFWIYRTRGWYERMRTVNSLVLWLRWDDGASVGWGRDGPFFTVASSVIDSEWLEVSSCMTQFIIERRQVDPN